MSEKLLKLKEMLKDNPELKAKLEAEVKRLGDEDAVQQAVKSVTGIELTAEELKTAAAGQELTKDQLEQVAGGGEYCGWFVLAPLLNWLFGD